jgi:hypothetical protein
VEVGDLDDVKGGHADSRTGRQHPTSQCRF